MIVDINTRIWESTEQLGPAVAQQMLRRQVTPWDRPAASTDAHDAAMAKIETAVILGFESAYLKASIAHECVAKYVKRNPSKYLGFMGIDPTAGNAVASLERGLALGLAGVTVSPSAGGFHPSNTDAMELYEACEARNVPVFIEFDAMFARDVKMEFGQPYLLDEVARTFPNLKIVINSLGHPWIEQAIALIGKHPTVYTDLTDLIRRPWQLYNALLLAHQQGVTSQIIFGSGFPYCTPEKAIMTIYSVNTLVQGMQLPSVPREVLRSIIERDTLGLLGLQKPASANDGDASKQKLVEVMEVVVPSPDEQNAEAADAAAASEAQTLKLADDEPIVEQMPVIESESDTEEAESEEK
ncbi:Amidohydrolase [Poriferisphaera corsica]|uniref:Amidohydrolase n=1 Tax=Poriferisphaera corsica TaxID=2528020 RepID=A0A517YSN0_9BACT|nr:amidohydrolase family protein [Poriferisphaera corsica]QDU33224.1 Amidohydrolase [Poriferisphaera corsica]